MATQTASKNGAMEVIDREAITIEAPKFARLRMRLRGTAPYMQSRFSEKARREMREKMAAGSTTKKGKKREARDFDADFEGALHRSTDGWYGIPAAAFRNAAVDACRMAGYAMTRARMSVFVEADGLDTLDGTPLVRLDAPEPERTEMPVRQQQTVDLRVRPMWRAWEIEVTLTYDEDQFTERDVVNLIHRAGIQVGIGEGRPFSKSSNGLGYGTFEIVSVQAVG